MDSSERSSAGICRPACPIRVKRPTVFKETVFPPVLGPVMTNKSKSVPSSMSIGTTFFLSNRGCRPLRSFKRCSVLKIGKVPFSSMARAALAKIKSSVVISRWFSASASVCSPACALRSARIVSISSFSFKSSSFSSLLSDTTAAGSMKKVEPVEDWSCTMPGTCPLYSALTGMQYRSFRMVTTASCRYVR